MIASNPDRYPPALGVAVALACTYLLWGGSYLAIRIVLEALPPFALGGTRFILAGTLMFGWRIIAGDRPPTLREWRSAVIIGTLLFVGGTGGVIWAEQRMSSGITALLVATIPLWLVLVEWLRPGGGRPVRQAVVGVIVGFIGIAVLIVPDIVRAQGELHVPSALIVLAGTLCWAIGSIYTRTAILPASEHLTSGAEMLGGGVIYMLLSGLRGEWQKIELSGLTPTIVLANIYLIAASIIGFSAYVWLLKRTSVALASTYAYANPVVAVMLGSLLLAEPLTPRIAVAGTIIVAAVALTASPRARRTSRRPTRAA